MALPRPTSTATAGTKHNRPNGLNGQRIGEATNPGPASAMQDETGADEASSSGDTEFPLGIPVVTTSGPNTLRLSTNSAGHRRLVLSLGQGQRRYGACRHSAHEALAAWLGSYSHELASGEAFRLQTLFGVLPSPPSQARRPRSAPPAASQTGSQQDFTKRRRLDFLTTATAAGHAASATGNMSPTAGEQHTADTSVAGTVTVDEQRPTWPDDTMTVSDGASLQQQLQPASAVPSQVAHSLAPAAALAADTQADPPPAATAPQPWQQDSQTPSTAPPADSQAETVPANTPFVLPWTRHIQLLAEVDVREEVLHCTKTLFSLPRPARSQATLLIGEVAKTIKEASLHGDGHTQTLLEKLMLLLPRLLWTHPSVQGDKRPIPAVLAERLQRFHRGEWTQLLLEARSTHSRPTYPTETGEDEHLSQERKKRTWSSQLFLQEI